MNVIFGFAAMTGLVILLLLIVVVPRATSRVTLGRFRSADHSSKDDPQPPPGDSRWADFLEQWSRTCTAGSSLHSGFLQTLEQFPDLDDFLADVSLGLRRGSTLVDLESHYLPSHWRRLLHLVGRTQRITPLGREAERLRRAESERLEVSAQLAAIRTSISILVWAPIYVSGFILLIGSSARTFMLGSPGGLSIVLVGTSLQMVGRRWVSRLLRSSINAQSTEVLDDIASSLEVGFTVHQALLFAVPQHNSPTHPLSAAELLDILRQQFIDLRPAFDLLAGSSQHGLPLADRLNEYIASYRARKAEEFRAHIRRMSVKANIPLVACILPSFLLLTFSPLIATIVTPLGSIG